MSKRFIDRVSFYIQRRAHNIQLRNLICGVHRLFLPNPGHSAGINSLQIAKQEDEIYNELATDGFSHLGFVLSESQIASIVSKLNNVECFDTAKLNRPVVDLSNPGNDVQLAHYTRNSLAEFPEIVAIANDSKILNVVSKYLGVKPTISNINCWWSFGSRESAKEAQFYHRDMDDFKFVKLFFYLTDVTADSGPHIFVKGSHKSNKLTELRRFSDDEVIESFGNEKITTLIEAKGACFLEDTYGVHKGQLPIKGNRLLLQVQYSYGPLHVENYQPKKSDLSKSMNLDEYVNRLIISK